MLVVEDEQDLAAAIGRSLRHEGYAVDVSHAGDDALVKASTYPYDVICLDLNLPRLDGREVCRRLRAGGQRNGRPQPRILMLTARAGLDDRIGGLDDGADDYLVKPFELRELAARVRALLRRPVEPGDGNLRVGALELDPARHDATQDGRAAQPDAEGVLAAPLLHVAPGRGAVGVRAPHARLGREREPTDADGARDGDDAPAQALEQRTASSRSRPSPASATGSGLRVDAPGAAPVRARAPDPPVLDAALRAGGTRRRRALPRPLDEPPRRAALAGRRHTVNRAGQRQRHGGRADVRRGGRVRAAGERAHASEPAPLLDRRAARASS